MKARRRGFASWFVEPYKQVKLGLVFLFLNILFAALIFGTFAYFLNDIFEALSTYFQMSGQESSVTMSKFQTPLVIAGVLVLAFVVTTILVSVRYTHRIYGPLVSINRFMDELLAGRKPAAIHLRESDQLQDLANKLNRLSDKLNK